MFILMYVFVCGTRTELSDNTRNYLLMAYKVLIITQIGTYIKVLSLTVDWSKDMARLSEKTCKTSQEV